MNEKVNEIENMNKFYKINKISKNEQQSRNEWIYFMKNARKYFMKNERKYVMKKWTKIFYKEMNESILWKNEHNTTICVMKNPKLTICKWMKISNEEKIN